ncbi:MAG TPA: aromatic ring-hydroxylating dioxygenase subunit alpha [Ramlibacter sp.]|nr:aromatic ring-hydroxylating dioxygenase subunit alpha [Ramlibacter sp.]
MADPPTREQVRALVEPDRVHRDLYTSPHVFEWEQRHFFANTWNYVAHASQVPAAGDFITVTIAGRPLLLLRQSDGGIRVLHNRCAHKGVQLVTAPAGNVGRTIRCPYHAWSYRLDGTLLGVPRKQDFEGTRLHQSESGAGLEAVRSVAVYRDFVFARLGDTGPDFETYCGGMLRVIDLLVDRSPTGRLQVAGGCLKTLVRCNWKMYLENINDTVHPLSAHESATSAARSVWRGQPDDAPKPMAMEQILPFGSGLDFYEGMGGRIHPNGHSVLGIHFSLHSAYGQMAEYEQALRQAHGEERATEVLQRSPQNAVIFPSLSLKSSPQAIRVIRPIAADRTVIEAWSFQVEGGPGLLLQRALTYNRLVFSPMSVVAHDDLHLFESAQRGLAAGRNDWVSLHRSHRAGEFDAPVQEVGGTNEILMRNQFRAWVEYMSLDLPL